MKKIQLICALLLSVLLLFSCGKTEEPNGTFSSDHFYFEYAEKPYAAFYENGKETALYGTVIGGCYSKPDDSGNVWINDDTLMFGYKSVLQSLSDVGLPQITAGNSYKLVCGGEEQKKFQVFNVEYESVGTYADKELQTLGKGEYFCIIPISNIDTRMVDGTQEYIDLGFFFKLTVD